MPPVEFLSQIEANLIDSRLEASHAQFEANELREYVRRVSAHPEASADERRLKIKIEDKLKEYERSGRPLIYQVQKGPLGAPGQGSPISRPPPAAPAPKPVDPVTKTLQWLFSFFKRGEQNAFNEGRLISSLARTNPRDVSTARLDARLYVTSDKKEWCFVIEKGNGWVVFRSKNNRLRVAFVKAGTDTAAQISDDFASSLRTPSDVMRSLPYDDIKQGAHGPYIGEDDLGPTALFTDADGYPDFRAHPDKEAAFFGKASWSDKPPAAVEPPPAAPAPALQSLPPPSPEPVSEPIPEVPEARPEPETVSAPAPVVVAPAVEVVEELPSATTRTSNTAPARTIITAEVMAQRLRVAEERRAAEEAERRGQEFLDLLGAAQGRRGRDKTGRSEAPTVPAPRVSAPPKPEVVSDFRFALPATALGMPAFLRSLPDFLDEVSDPTHQELLLQDAMLHDQFLLPVELEAAQSTPSLYRTRTGLVLSLNPQGNTARFYFPTEEPGIFSYFDAPLSRAAPENPRIQVGDTTLVLSPLESDPKSDGSKLAGFKISEAGQSSQISETDGKAQMNHWAEAYNVSAVGTARLGEPCEIVTLSNGLQLEIRVTKPEPGKRRIEIPESLRFVSHVSGRAVGFFTVVGASQRVLYLESGGQGFLLSLTPQGTLELRQRTAYFEEQFSPPFAHGKVTVRRESSDRESSERLGISRRRMRAAEGERYELTFYHGDWRGALPTSADAVTALRVEVRRSISGKVTAQVLPLADWEAGARNNPWGSSLKARAVVEPVWDEAGEEMPGRVRLIVYSNAPSQQGAITPYGQVVFGLETLFGPAQHFALASARFDLTPSAAGKLLPEQADYLHARPGSGATEGYFTEQYFEDHIPDEAERKKVLAKLKKVTGQESDRSTLLEILRLLERNREHVRGADGSYDPDMVASLSAFARQAATAPKTSAPPPLPPQLPAGSSAKPASPSHEDQTAAAEASGLDEPAGPLMCGGEMVEAIYRKLQEDKREELVLDQVRRSVMELPDELVSLINDRNEPHKLLVDNNGNRYVVRYTDRMGMNHYEVFRFQKDHRVFFTIFPQGSGAYQKLREAFKRGDTKPPLSIIRVDQKDEKYDYAEILVHEGEKYGLCEHPTFGPVGIFQETSEGTYTRKTDEFRRSITLLFPRAAYLGPNVRTSDTSSPSRANPVATRDIFPKVERCDPEEVKGILDWALEKRVGIRTDEPIKDSLKEVLGTADPNVVNDLDKAKNIKLWVEKEGTRYFVGVDSIDHPHLFIIFRYAKGEGVRVGTVVLSSSEGQELRTAVRTDAATLPSFLKKQDLYHPILNAKVQERNYGIVDHPAGPILISVMGYHLKDGSKSLYLPAFDFLPSFLARLTPLTTSGEIGKARAPVPREAEQKKPSSEILKLLRTLGQDPAARALEESGKLPAESPPLGELIYNAVQATHPKTRDLNHLETALVGIKTLSEREGINPNDAYVETAERWSQNPTESGFNLARSLHRERVARVTQAASASERLNEGLQKDQIGREIAKVEKDKKEEKDRDKP